MEKNLFLTGLLLSFFVHAATIGLLSLSHARLSLFKKSSKSIEITYQRIKSATRKNKEIVVKDLKVSKDLKPQKKQTVKVLSRENNMFSIIGDRIKDISKLRGNLLASQKKSPTVSMLDTGRKITLPPMGTTKISNPKYITYNDDMRAVISRNIKRRAYTYVNHKDFEAGKVYLTFVLSSSGMLKQLQIIDSKTSANEYLRNVGIKSIRESSPFPPFPMGFNYPEFTFNLLISFQD